MKQTILFLALLIVAMESRAEQALVVYTTEGRAAAFVVSGEPRITTSADEVTVSTGVKSASYSLSDLDHFALEELDLATGVDSKQIPCPVFRVGGDGICCEGLAPGEQIQVYDLGGRLVRQAVANGSGCASVPMLRGTYVVKTKSKTFKTTKR